MASIIIIFHKISRKMCYNCVIEKLLTFYHICRSIIITELTTLYQLSSNLLRFYTKFSRLLYFLTFLFFMKWREKIGYYAKEIKKEMRETGRATSGDFKSLQGFYSDKEKIKKALSRVDELIELYDEDKEKVVNLKEIKKLLSVSSINEARQNLIAYKGADSYLEEIQKILEK